MRTDGQVIFWQVQQLVEDQWSTVELSVERSTVSDGTLHNKLWREHTANGKCWQLWGYFGFLDVLEAMDGIDYAHEVLPRAHLRLVRIELSKKTDEVVDFE